MSDKLPESVVIGGVLYQVKEVEDLGHDGADYYGYVDHMERRIDIEQKMVFEVQVQALVHEMMHGLFLQTGPSGYEWEERIVQMLGCQLPKLLRDNPELVKLMLDEADVPLPVPTDN